MECHYHPDRQATDVCAICGKTICKECGLEIAGKIYCKECLEKIVGLGIDSGANKVAEPVAAEPVKVEETDNSIYQPQEETYVQTPEPVSISKAISDDSPYNIKDSIEYTGGLESSYIQESEQPVRLEKQPEVAQNEIDYQTEPTLQQPVDEEEFIYPDHSYQPEPTSARQSLEDKYEKYLDDLYFDEAEVPLGEQLAKDEEQYGSLTRKPYKPKPADEQLVEKVTEDPLLEKAPKNETPEEMEARIRAELMREMQGGKESKLKDKKENIDNIHNINYKDDKEPMGVVDILLTILLILVILIVVYYLIYLFLLSSTYPTFLDALYALTNPQNVINNILSR